jgi:hypothetical protein
VIDLLRKAVGAEAIPEILTSIRQKTEREREIIRRFGAKPDKKIVDRQAASPSSWKTPFIATSIAW